MEENLEMWALADGNIISNTHPQWRCRGRIGGCALHNPSDHALRDAPLVMYRGRLGRRCEHQDHPDLDDAVYLDDQGTQSAYRYARGPSWLHECACDCCGIDQSYWQPDSTIEETE
ncbi:hypothetical protein [Nocardioides sp.]|uniref:hypothetical protein n=1 Tax=Nocardioides sp. TaxID=35761 RepID=UPI00286C58FC|nr:hypothetical protein [Nocardioides sp.]